MNYQQTVDGLKASYRRQYVVYRALLRHCNRNTAPLATLGMIEANLASIAARLLLLNVPESEIEALERPEGEA